MEHLSKRQQLLILILLCLIHAFLLILIFSPWQQPQVILQKKDPAPVIIDLRKEVATPIPEEKTKETPPKNKPLVKQEELHQEQARMKSRSGNALMTPSEVENATQQLKTALISDTKLNRGAQPTVTTPEQTTKTQDNQAAEASEQETTTALKIDEINDAVDKTALSIDIEHAQSKPTQTAPVTTKNQNQIQKRTPADSNKMHLQQPNQQISLADITRGILSHHKHAGTDCADMEGKKGIKPSLEQLKQAHYIAKLQSCVQISMSYHTPPKNQRNGLKSYVDLSFMLHENGTISHSTVTQSCGNIELDEYIIFIFQDASKSFPPIPASLQKKQWPMHWKIKIYS